MNSNEKSKRLIETAARVLHSAPNHSLNAVVLNKVLFYLDLAALRDRGQTVTDNSYIALQNGPVVAKYLDGDLMVLASDVTNFFSDSTSRSASEFSHKNPGWQIAWNQFMRENKPVAINMRIAMQQIIESDPWMQTPFNDSSQLLTAADDGIGDDW